MPARPPAATLLPVLPLPRWFAIVQAISVCGIPTQVVVFALLWQTTDLIQFEKGGLKLTLALLATSTLLDTALIALLMRLFLDLSGETSRDVFLGRRPVWGEIARGLLIVPVAVVA